jgi:hypothetical protein
VTYVGPRSTRKAAAVASPLVDRFKQKIRGGKGSRPARADWPGHRGVYFFLFREPVEVRTHTGNAPRILRLGVPSCLGLVVRLIERGGGDDGPELGQDFRMVLI